MADQISLLKAQAQVAQSHFRLCLSITMKTKARLFYLLLACFRNGDWNGGRSR
jgi:hypothetical protein